MNCCHPFTNTTHCQNPAMARRKSTGDVEPAAAPKRAGGRRHSSMAEEGPSDTTPAARTSKASKGKGKGGGGKKARMQVEEEQQEVVVEQEGEEEAPLFFIDREESAAGASAAPDSTAEENADADEGMVVAAGEKEGEAKDKGKKGKKSKKARRRGDGDDEGEGGKGEEEALLELLVFGKVDAAELFGGSAPATHDDEEEADTAWAAAEGGTPSLRPAWEDEDDEGVQVDIAGKDRLRKLRKGPEERAVSGAEYQERLRARFQNANKAALDWAALPDETEGRVRGRRRRRRTDSESSGSDEEEAEEEDENEALFTGLFQSSAPLVGGGGGSKRRLQPGVLEVLRCRDANLQEPSQAVVQALQFHPSTQQGLLLTGGFDKTLRLFQVDGKRNEKRAGIFFPDLPIQSAAFVDPSGQGDFGEVVLSGRRPFFYWYDLATGAAGQAKGLLGRPEERSLERFAASPDGKWLAFTGKDGYVLLASARTKQWAGEFKMNGTARAVCFSQDGGHLLASGGDAVVYRWDLRSKRCLARFRNEGGTVTSSLAHGPGALTAVGAESGVVNLYDDADTLLPPAAAAGKASASAAVVVEADVQPLKALPNLVTTVDSLQFNHDGQLLCLASRWKRDALRVVHVPTRTVFANWPTGQTPIRYPSAVGFSPNSGLLAVGNDRGRVLLYRLRHYDAQ